MLAEFLDSLFKDGRLRVDRELPIVDESVRSRLREYESLWRAQRPHDPPEFDVAAAEWAAKVLYQACQFVVYREASEQDVVAALGVDAEDNAKYMAANSAAQKNAKIHYSVDFIFHFLPSLWQLARRVSAGDVLVSALQDIAGCWPLSSVGMEFPNPIRWHAVFDDSPSLRIEYIDRVLATREESRLVDERVRDAVRIAVGMNTNSADRMMTALERFEKDAPNHAVKNPGNVKT